MTKHPQEIYLDHAATMPLHPQVMEAMLPYFEDHYYNPSALYWPGGAVEKVLKQCKESFALKIGVTPEEVFFNSGGTEGNNTLIRGVVEDLRPALKKDARLITTMIEHPSVMEVFRFYEAKGMDVVYLPVDDCGRVKLDVLKKEMTEKTVLVSIVGVSNEIGTAQDLKAIGAIIKRINPNCIFHSDFVQGFLKMPLDIAASHLDAVTFCAHKVMGPKGIGALYLKKGSKCAPLLLGGGQENNFRSGTENVPSIVGMVEAIKIFSELHKHQDRGASACRRALLQVLEKELQDFKVIEDPQGSPYVLCLSISGIKAEVLLHALEKENIYLSTGSACSKHSKEDQRTLRALGLSDAEREGAIRLSFSPLSEPDQMEKVAEAILRQTAYIRKIIAFRKGNK
ncbi:MAG: cysteine desulfurase [Eubacteriaceae bacterium]|jgi:cysteine desulfurase|nr:cysteine desulfurase [Eubacteriaceae bacterium]